MTYQDPGVSGFAFPPMSPMVKRIVIANAAVYAFTLLLYLVSTEGYRLLGHSLGIHPRSWAEFAPLLPVWQLATYGFLHSLGPTHILFNMLALYFFASMVEGTVGSRRFLFAYGLGLVVPGLVWLLWTLATAPAGGLPDGLMTLGASGAVYMMICAAATFQPDARVILIVFPIKLVWLAVGIMAIGTINGLIGFKSGASDGVNHMVHVVGGLLGFLMVRQRWIWKDPLGGLQQRREQLEQDRRQSNEQRLDELLSKIKREGIHSLSRAERAFLKRYSSRR